MRELPVLWTFSMPALISGVVAVPVLWVCKVMLANQEDGYEAIAVIAVAESWRMIPFFICTMIAQANLPVLSQLYGSGDLRRFKKALMAQFYLNAVIVLLGASVVIVFAKFIMASYGPTFVNDSFVLVLIILGTVPTQLTTVVGTANRCMGKMWVNLLLNSIWAAAFMLGTYTLVTHGRHGAVGLAWAALIAYSLQCVVAMTYFALVIRVRAEFGSGGVKTEQQEVVLDAGS